MKFDEFIKHYPNNYTGLSKAYNDILEIKSEMENRIMAMGRRLNPDDVIGVMERMNNDPDLAKFNIKFDIEKIKKS